MKVDKRSRLEDRMGRKASVIASGAHFKGVISGQDSVRICGYFEGEIKIDGLVWIEKAGKMAGSVTAPYVIIEGEMEGDVVSARHIEIRREGRIRGDIKSDIIAIEEGSSVEGEMRMSAKAGDNPAPFIEKRKDKRIIKMERE